MNIFILPETDSGNHIRDLFFSFSALDHYIIKQPLSSPMEESEFKCSKQELRRFIKPSEYILPRL